ncbi:MAG: hypothetical protein AVDCRST_MAG90-480 [uncultured Microvirga sp.]|uniref:DUF29 domain-containing protein n=1 Tax=uncultured Microvirga sp. TaxID=412392 RepID=A0A6J4KQT8_9HYPH|nr:MAG: hypothetical protein AVDCRST_MAG90-480 [uncultured Microvirga sp.]
MATDTLYESDFFVWTERQAEELRRAAREGSNLPLDWSNLAEEIESLGKSDRRSLHRRVYQILRHLLKLKYSRVQDPRHGWQDEVQEHRWRLRQVLRDSPSLRRLLPDAVSEEWRPALNKAARDLQAYGEDLSLATLLDDGPDFTPEEIADEEWFPEPARQRSDDGLR